jgi:hypothetical protein
MACYLFKHRDNFTFTSDLHTGLPSYILPSGFQIDILYVVPISMRATCPANTEHIQLLRSAPRYAAVPLICSFHLALSLTAVKIG